MNNEFVTPYFNASFFQIIDARVADLELQIEEMKQKISTTEDVIKQAEFKKAQNEVIIENFIFIYFGVNYKRSRFSCKNSNGNILHTCCSVHN